MKTFKVGFVTLIALGMFMLTGCGMTTIEPGHTGIKINKLGTDRGVSKDNIVSGLTFYNPVTSKVIQYPTFNQRVAWTASPNEGKSTNEELSAQSRDNVPFTFDVAVNYTLKADKVPEFYTQFRCDKIDFFTHGFLRDKARSSASDIASEYSFDDINGPKKEEFVKRLNENLAAIVAPYGVEIGKNGVSLIGALRPPQNLKDAINARVQAIQDSIKAENELRTYKANAAKAVAQAEGEAASMRAKAASLTPGIMEWRRLEIEAARVAKWNGVYPTTVMGTGAGSNLIYNMK